MAYRPKDAQERILHRLKIARGHLNKVIKMVEEDHYCIDVIYQSRAVENAIKEVDGIILENHLNICASNAIKRGKGKEAIAEIMSVFKNDK